MIESLRLGLKPGIRKAAEIGTDGFQVYASRGDLAPWNLSGTGRRDFRRLVDSLGLEVSALCGDLGGGYTDPTRVDELVHKAKQILDLSADLGVSVVTTHIGAVPDDEKSPTWGVLSQALGELARHADRVGSVIAAETGPEDAPVLRRFLDHVGEPGLKVNYDPANLVMRGFDHLAGVLDLGPYIVHTHAKDGVRRSDGDRTEVPLGQGQVRWPEYLARLEQVGYHGFYTIEREAGPDPVADITQAVRFLRGF